MLKNKKRYKQLNLIKRNTLYRLCKEKIKIEKIAQLLGVHRSTLYRELKRNQHCQHRTYLPDSAQRLCFERRNRPGSKIKGSKRLQQTIQEGIAMSLSPEMIAGRLKLEHCKHIISHESIYKWIYTEGKALKLHEGLLRRKRRRGLRASKKATKSNIPYRTSIHQRPQAPKGQMGHWEADTIVLSKGKGAILVLYDKATKVIFGANMQRRNAEETLDTLKTILSHLPSELSRTITFDNGGEFTQHRQLRQTFGIETYFCDPYSSWQKGGVENANSLIRRYIPKKSKSEDFSPRKVPFYY